RPPCRGGGGRAGARGRRRAARRPGARRGAGRGAQRRRGLRPLPHRSADPGLADGPGGAAPRRGRPGRRRAGTGGRAGGARHRPGLPIVVATGGLPAAVAEARRDLAAGGVAAYDGVAGAVTGVRALVEDARARAARAIAGPPVRLVIPDAFVVPAGEDEGKHLLGWLGIATPRRVACDDRAQAHTALAGLRRPVV